MERVVKILISCLIITVIVGAVCYAVVKIREEDDAVDFPESLVIEPIDDYSLNDESVNDNLFSTITDTPLMDNGEISEGEKNNSDGTELIDADNQDAPLSSNHDKINWSEMKCLMIGDSIFWHDGHENMFGGGEMMVGFGTYLKNEFNFKALSNFSASGACIAYHDNQFEDIVSNVKADIDFSLYDVVIVEGGVNDFFYQNSPMGSWKSGDFDITTFYGALQFIMEKAKTENPNAIIILCTPLKCTGWDTPNEHGLTLEDYANAITHVGKAYGAYVLDLFNYSEFSDNMTKYSIDGCHPNNEGYKDISLNYMIPFIKNM